MKRIEKITLGILNEHADRRSIHYANKHHLQNEIEFGTEIKLTLSDKFYDLFKHANIKFDRPNNKDYFFMFNGKVMLLFKEPEENKLSTYVVYNNYRTLKTKTYPQAFRFLAQMIDCGFIEQEHVVDLSIFEEFQ